MTDNRIDAEKTGLGFYINRFKFQDKDLFKKYVQGIEGKLVLDEDGFCWIKENAELLYNLGLELAIRYDPEPLRAMFGDDFEEQIRAEIEEDMY